MLKLRFLIFLSYTNCIYISSNIPRSVCRAETVILRIIILLLFVILCVGSGFGIAIHILLLPVQNHLAPSGYVKIPNVSMAISTVVGALFTSSSF